MHLSDLAWGESGRVIRIEGGHGFQSRLHRLGIHPGDEIRVSSGGAFHGPLLVEVQGSRVALGRGVARRIHIEPNDMCRSSLDPDSCHCPKSRRRRWRFGRRRRDRHD